MGGFAAWFTTIVGTPVALIAFVMAGAGKAIPLHPMNKAMVFGFENVFGPFLGMPGMILRLIIGIGEMVGGCGLLIGLWGDACGGFGGEFGDVVKSLIIVASVALFIVWSVASLMHQYIDHMPNLVTILLAIVSLLIVLIRMFWCGPEYVENQVMCTVLSILCMLGAVATVFINKFFGKHESAVDEQNKELAKMLRGEA